jgi:antitoxin HigA-1
MAKHLKPIHPGEVLREEFMIPFKMNANSLALALHVSAPAIYEITREQRGISAEMAIRLAHLFGNTPNFWLNLQSEYDLRVTRIKKESEIERQVHRIVVEA